jgi:hypothetical protein
MPETVEEHHRNGHSANGFDGDTAADPCPAGLAVFVPAPSPLRQGSMRDDKLVWHAATVVGDLAGWALALSTRADLSPFLSRLARESVDNRVMLLTAIVRRLRALPAEHRFEGVLRVLAEVWQLPHESRVPVLQALTRRLHEIPESRQYETFTVILAATMRLAAVGSAMVWTTLVQALNAVCTHWRLRALLDLAGQMNRLAPIHRAERISALARELVCLPEAQRMMALDALMAAARKVDAGHRNVALVALCWGIEVLPASVRGAAAHEMLREIVRTPRDKWPAPLAELGAALASVPPQDRTGTLASLVEAAMELHPSFRHEPLSGLIRGIAACERTDELFDRLLQEVLLLPSAGRARCLAALAARVGDLSPSRRSARFQALLHAVDGLPAHARAPALETVFSQTLPSLPEHVQEDAFHQGLATILRMPPAARPSLVLDVELA